MVKEAIRQQVIELIDDKQAALVEISQFIHQHPELAYEEHRAVAKLTGYLQLNDYPVTLGIGQLETAFQASYGDEEGPHIAILAEYDALPKIGHACGHNVIATSALGAYLATVEAMKTQQISGKVSLIGTPAEESGGGKIDLIKAGIFSDVDAAMMVHPTSGTTRIAGRCTTTHKIGITFKGQSAHAASQPFKGINALDAANLFLVSIGLLRQQLTSDVRLSCILTEGGTASNMIPDKAILQLSIRCMEKSELADLVTKVKNCIAAASLATGCQHELEEETGYSSRTYSEILGDICRTALESFGESVLPGFPDDFGSTDFGDVSQLMPTVNPYFSLNPVRTSLHTEEYEKLAISPISEKAINYSAKSMALTTLELLLKPELIEQAKQEKNAKQTSDDRPR